MHKKCVQKSTRLLRSLIVLISVCGKVDETNCGQKCFKVLNVRKIWKALYVTPKNTTANQKQKDFTVGATHNEKTHITIVSK